MSILFSSVIRAMMYFAGGVGVTSMIDKFFPDKLPAGTAPLINVNETATGKISWLKVILLIVVGAVGILIVRFVGDKLKIKILK